MKKGLKSAVSMLLSIALLLSICILPANAVEVEDYIAVSTKQDFYNIRNNPNLNYYLTNDIHIEEEDYWSTGIFKGGFEHFANFHGTLDGCGHAISGLVSDYGITGSNYGTIKNLEFKSCEFRLAAFARSNDNNIINCKISDTIIGNSTSTTYDRAGIVSYNNGTIRYCSVANDCTIYGDGGISSENYGTIDYCVNYANFNLDDDIGGISANNEAVITNCINNGNLSSTGGDVGGISAQNSGVIENCVNNGEININSGNWCYAAGIAAKIYNSTYGGKYIKNCLNTGKISTLKEECASGISHYRAGQPLYCVNTGTVTSKGVSSYAFCEPYYKYSSDKTPQEESIPRNCYYKSGSGLPLTDENGTVYGTSFTNSQLSESYLSGLDFENVWKLENGKLSLRCEEAIQTAITAYQYPEKTYFLRGQALDISDDLLVFGLYSSGEWYDLFEDEYTINGYDPNKLGKQKITVNSVANEENSFNFNVYVQDTIDKQSIKLSKTEYVYSGVECKPTVTITDRITRRRLTSGKDYSVSYSKNINAGTAKVTITGKGNYKGSTSKTFKIVPRNISTVSFSGLPKSTSYTGKYIKPTVKAYYNGKTLKNSTDYTVSYKNNLNAGTATVTVKGKGNYTGSKNLTFKISPISISKLKLSLSPASYTYNGKVKAPKVIVKDSAKKTISSKSYTVSYQSGRKNVGKYKVTVKMKGNYSGSKNLYFTINPPTTTVSKLVAGKKSATVYITKKSSQVSGYQIQYATNKKFSGAKTKTISSYKTTKCSLTGLSAKKYYYVRVRTFKKVSGKTYYSGWSTLKYVKTK